VFYWLAVLLSVLYGLTGVFTGILAMAVNPFGGVIAIVGSLISVLIGVLVARIVAEFVLITFRINEHLGAIRNRGQMLPSIPEPTFAGPAPAGRIFSRHSWHAAAAELTQPRASL
jgi:hypothetical protein